MKKLLIVSALAATSTVVSAMDYKIDVEGKVDYINQTSKTTARSTGVVTEAKEGTFAPGTIAPGTIRFNMLANVNDSLSLRMRYRVGANGSATTRDGSTSALDYFFVDHKNSLFTTRFGKQAWNEAFGRETMISGDDLMIVSDVYTAVKSAAGIYRYGVSALRSVDGVGNFTLALSNPNLVLSDASTGVTKKNTSPAMGVYYNGSFMNKMVQPVLGYTLLPQDGDTDNTNAALQTKKGNNTVMAYGLRSEVSGVVFDIDYKDYKKADINSGTNATASNMQTKTKSMYANVAYSINEFTPFVAYMNDKLTDDGTTTNNYKKTTFAFGAWYKPYADVNFRYDLHMLSAKQDYSDVASTNSQIKSTAIYFGFKADI